MLPSFLSGCTSLVALLTLLSFAGSIGATVHRRHTHRTRILGRGLKIESYHPATTFTTYEDGLELPEMKSFTVLNASINAMATSFLQSQLGIDSASISYHSGYSSESGTFAYFKQTHDGIPFANAVANAAFDGDMKVVSLGHSFVTPGTIASSTPSLTVEEAIPIAEQALLGRHNGHPPTLEYLALPDGSVALTHAIHVQNNAKATWYEAFIDAHSGDLLSVTDFVAHAEYTVVPIDGNDILHGTAKVVDPEDIVSSPLGWHNNGTVKSTATVGNNAIAFFSPELFNIDDLWEYQTTQESQAVLIFDYNYNTTIDPTEGRNLDAARANAFYVTNTVHDVYYKYGFTEVAFNFQTSNFGKGGADGDPVFVSVHDVADTNNANFAAPPDGMGGLCRMYIWNLTEPSRDGAEDNDILIHENTHGLSARMTGGGTTRCLQTGEAGGLSEGWSDMMADWFQQTAEMKDYVTGTYATGDSAGARTYPYSTNITVNPLMYSNANVTDNPDDPDDDPLHFVGEIWTNMLHNVLAALVKQWGWSNAARTNPSGTEGNIVFLHIFIDGLAIQPCNPTFQNARDAIIQADKVRYAGANKCLLWKAFASRGLGVDAKPYEDDTSIPAGC